MVDQDKIRQAVRILLEGIGEDISREGLLAHQTVSQGCTQNSSPEWRKTPETI